MIKQVKIRQTETEKLKEKRRNSLFLLPIFLLMKNSEKSARTNLDVFIDAEDLASLAALLPAGSPYRSELVSWFLCRKETALPPKP